MRKHKIFRTNQGLTLVVEILYKLSYVTPFLLLIVISILRGISKTADLSFILINGLILILIAYPLKQKSYFWKLGALYLLAIGSQFVNLFIESSN